MSFPVFDRPVARNGYAWWYVDALSDDGQYGLTLIAFIGNVFSPYYHHARRYARDGARAENHAAINIALYGRTKRWAMTERGHQDLEVAADRFVLAGSRLDWDGQRLTIQVAERGAPLPYAITGRIIVEPQAITPAALPLDFAGHHHWHPIAPRSQVRVALDKPALSWSGTGYLDHNRGDRALETDFQDWEWSRVAVGDQTAIHYDTRQTDGDARHYALRIDEAGRVAHVPPADWYPLASTPIWRMPRHARSEDEDRTFLRQTLEDTPFYSRSALTTQIDGRTANGVHESLSLKRFENPLVRYLLRCRMPRIAYR